MENASKALIIAGSILIAIMIISLGVLVFNKFGGTAKDMANMDEQEIKAFNNKLTPYMGNAVKGSQVNALMQYCLSVNKANSEQTFKQIEIEALNSGAKSLAKTANTFDRVETGTKTYEVRAVYDDNGLITKITVKQN